MINLHARIVEQSAHHQALALGSKFSPLSSQSFMQQFQDAFAETLSRFGIDPSTIKLTVQDNSRQSGVTGQVLATTANAPITANPMVGFNALIPTSIPNSTTHHSAPAAPVSSSSTQHWYASDAADDQYWAKQPAAVQKLREIDNPEQRVALASQLSAQGYHIDVPIMEWGWDAGKVTALRQGFGYTWVPSAMQQPVQVAPGLTFAGQSTYDPNNPPPGSIAV